MIDDLVAYFGSPVYVGFARPVVASLYHIDKQPVNTVAVVLVVLGCINSSLRSHCMGSSRGIVITEGFHVVSQFTQGRRCCRSCNTGTDNDNIDFPFVCGIDQFNRILVICPLQGKRAIGDLSIEFFHILSVFYLNCHIVIEITAKPAGIAMAYIQANTLTTGVQNLWLSPRV